MSRERGEREAQADSAEAYVGLEPINSEITTWAKIKSQPFNPLSHPGALWPCFEKKKKKNSVIAFERLIYLFMMVIVYYLSFPAGTAFLEDSEFLRI